MGPKSWVTIIALIVPLCSTTAWVTREVIVKDEKLRATMQELLDTKAELIKTRAELSKYEGNEFHVGRPQEVPGTNVTATLRTADGKLLLRFDDEAEDDVNVGIRTFRNGPKTCRVHVNRIDGVSVTLTELRCGPDNPP
jgi:hypothetical protein